MLKTLWEMWETQFFINILKFKADCLYNKKTIMGWNALIFLDA